MTALVVLQVLFILFIHWVADFLLQTENMATKKSTSNYWLTQHVLAYAVGIIPIGLLVFFMGHVTWAGAILWVVLNSGLHWLTDYYTSRWTSQLYATKNFYNPNKYFKYFNFPAFFSVIGLDQIIHYSCLFITYAAFT